MLYWQLTQLGVACDVIAPSLVPTKAGDRVKTDRRDAEKLARCYRDGELTAVWVGRGVARFGEGSGDCEEGSVSGAAALSKRKQSPQARPTLSRAMIS